MKAMGARYGRKPNSARSVRYHVVDIHDRATKPEAAQVLHGLDAD
jgi:hypothetical protein